MSSFPSPLAEAEYSEPDEDFTEPPPGDGEAEFRGASATAASFGGGDFFCTFAVADSSALWEAAEAGFWPADAFEDSEYALE